jgi:hypothetical protein
MVAARAATPWNGPAAAAPTTPTAAPLINERLLKPDIATLAN